MRIFLSYAAERHSMAQQVDAALEAEGHEVFFASDSIAAATRFGRAIREAVGASDLFVYLVSPESVEPGSYCLTELGYARERWPDPAGKVLPVIVAPTPSESFPAYVQSLSALYPTGNLPAEVVASVERMRRGHRRIRLRSGLMGLAALGAVAGAGAAVWARARDGAANRPFLSVAALAEVRPAVAGARAGQRQRAEPVTAHRQHRETGPRPGRRSSRLAGGAVRPDRDRRQRRRELLGMVPALNQWRYACHPEPMAHRIGHAGRSRRTCGSWSDWAEGPLSMAPPLEEGRRRRSRVVGAGEDGFLIGLSDPDELLLLGAGRDPVRRIPLPGEPTALAAAGGRVAVGTRAPDVLVMLGPGGERSEHRVPGDTSSGPEASTGISSIALTEREAWVTTEEADGRTVVHLLDLGSRQWVALPYAEARRGFNLPRIHLRAGASDVVWGVTKGTRPSSLYRLDRKGVEQFGGHQVAAVACTGDVAPAADGTIFVTSCDGSLLRGRPRLDGFATVADIDSRFFPLVKGDWRMQWIAGGEDTLAVAVTVLAVDSTRHKPVPLVSRIGWSIPGVDRALVGFERDSLTVASLAVRDTMALAAVTSARGVRDLVAVPLRRR